MPAGKDDDDSAACVQSGTHRGLVLVPQLIAVGGRFSLGAVLDGVIDDKQVCAIAGDGAADTNGDHAAHAVVEVPVRFGGLHLGDGMPKQRRTELLDLIAVPLAELLGKVAAVADLDDTLLWVLSQIERGEGFGHGHGLAVARRHEYHQPLGLPLHDAFQLLTHEVEVSGSFPPAHVDVLDIIGVVPFRQRNPGIGAEVLALGRRNIILRRHQGPRPFEPDGGVHHPSGYRTGMSEQLRQA